MKKFIAFILVFSGLLMGKLHMEPASANGVPPVGLTLSGGGAKGLAHIGVLHIIDSLGIRVDYISGTSMGSIVGGMYAAGYSAAEIDQIARQLDWSGIFSRRTSLEYTHPRKREVYGRYIIELPLENWRFKIPSGAIEGQQLWNVLSELFFHVRNIEDFHDFPIPFACVATDLGTGDAVILDKGDIVAAIRASMAIPSVFTTIEIDNRKLVDGGVVKNFPVTVVKDMGAEFVIGSNVAQGLREPEELITPVDVLYQMGFFMDARSFIQNRELTDLYIEPQMEEFTVTSFSDVDFIIERGKQAARQQLPALLLLKEKQQQLSGEPGISASTSSVEKHKAFVVDSLQFEGLANVRNWFVRNALELQKGDTVNISRINSSINRLFATGYFNRITYNLLPVDDTDKAILVYHFDEKPFARLGTAIHYSSFSGVGLIGNLATNKFLFYNTSASVKALLSETPAISGSIDLFVDDRHRSWFNFEGLVRYLNFPVFEDFEITGEYKQTYLRYEFSFNNLTGRNSYYSLGSAWYYQSLSPNMRAEYSVRGNIRSSELFAQWKHNSLNRQAFPQHGTRFELGSTFFFNQKPSLRFRNPEGEVTSNLSEAGIEISNYLQAFLGWESFIRVSPRLTSFNQVQAGYNFFYEQSFINMFNLGGTYPFLKNQMIFAGLNEYEIISKGIVAASMGWRYNIWDEFMITPLVNAALYNFEIDALHHISRDNFVLGAGVNIGYFSGIGPMEVSFAYSPQTRKVLAYLNLGWTF